MAKWADQWGSKVAQRYMMLEYGQPVLPWPHIRPILESVYKDSKMTKEDWQKEGESFNRLARGMAKHYVWDEEDKEK